MKRPFAAGASAIVAALLLAGHTWAASALTPTATGNGVLRFKLSGTAHGPNVLLKDVVEGELAEPLASMALKAAGRPGASVKVPKALVQLKLKGNKSDRRVEGPDVCELNVAVQKIPGADLRRFAFDTLSSLLSGTAGVSLEPRGKDEDLQTYDAPTRFNIKSSPADLRGNVVMRVQVLQPGAGGEEKEVASVPVSFVVHRKEARVYAKRAYRRGERFESAGLVLRDEDTTFSQAQGFAALDEVEGKQARAFVAAGRLVSADLVELPPVIKRGDIVRVVVKSGAILVDTTGRALRDARLGETLPIELDTTKKQVQARCVEAGVAVREAY